MRTILTTVLAFTLAAGVAFTQDKGKGGAPKAAPVPGMALTSPDFQDGGIIPDKFTQAVQNAPSPKLEWTQVPAGTQAFTILLHDPEPSINKTTEDVTHWLIFNIPGTARELAGGVAAGNLPDGSVQAKNRGNANAYMGPGNPAINPYHHYTFEMFALDAKLPLDENATRAQVMEAMNGHILGKAVLVGRFKRPQ
ncbi:MAG: YbhB/YbcL family Raf kinase inhibitor-like protein [Acidobacteriota bacterium]